MQQICSATTRTAARNEPGRFLCERPRAASGAELDWCAGLVTHGVVPAEEQIRQIGFNPLNPVIPLLRTLPTRVPRSARDEGCLQLSAFVRTHAVRTTSTADPSPRSGRPSLEYLALNRPLATSAP